MALPLIATAAGVGTGVIAALHKIFSLADKALDAKSDYDRLIGRSSLIKTSQPLRVEPLCIVDTDCVHLDYTPDVLQSLQTMFSGYFLQTVQLMGTVSGVQVARELDRLNPNRDPVFSAFLQADRQTRPGSKLDMQNYQWSLPTSKNQAALEAIDLSNIDNSNMSQSEAEALLAKIKAVKEAQASKDESKKVAPEKTSTMKDGNNVTINVNNKLPSNSSNKSILEGDPNSNDMKNTLMSVKELADLSVGKLLNVTINRDGQSIAVPVSIRLIVNELRPSGLIKLFGKGVMERTFIERYYKWRSGRISLINDLILCKDLIREHKKALMEDKEGVLTEIMERASRNKAAGLISRDPSFATASNLFVISETTAQALKRNSGIDLDSFDQRQKVFTDNYLMIMAVIDREYQRVTFYHDGIKLPTRVGIRDIKKANKDAGPSIMDVLQAYKQGQTPTL